MTHLKSKFLFLCVCGRKCFICTHTRTRTHACTHTHAHTMVFNQSLLCYGLLFLSPATAHLFLDPLPLFISLFCDPLILIRAAYVSMNMGNFLDLEQIAVTTPFRNVTSPCNFCLWLLWEGWEVGGTDGMITTHPHSC